MKDRQVKIDENMGVDKTETGGRGVKKAELEPKVMKIFWSYGENHKPLFNKSRFYVDLNLHVKTKNYNEGDKINITLKRNDGELLFGATQELNLSGTVSNNESVFENVLKEYTLNI